MFLSWPLETIRRSDGRLTVIPPRIWTNASRHARTGVSTPTRAIPRDTAGLNKPPDTRKKIHAETVSEKPKAREMYSLSSKMEAQNSGSQAINDLFEKGLPTHKLDVFKVWMVLWSPEVVPDVRAVCGERATLEMVSIHRAARRGSRGRGSWAGLT
jgi:hypothetical protein